MYYIGCESGFQPKIVCVSSQKWLLFWIFMHPGRRPDKKACCTKNSAAGLQKNM
jgi:hypothetical protein